MTKTAIELQVDGDHYKDAAVQPWEVVAVLARRRAERLLLAVDEASSIDEARKILAGAMEDFYYEGNQVKYLMREGTKKESQHDGAKAKHYGHQRLDTMTSQQKYIVTGRNLTGGTEVLTAYVKNEVAEVAARLIEIKRK